MKHYMVTTKHPTGWMDGTRLFTVSQDRDLFYATAGGFGCSKSYRSGEIAIRQMCADHACQVLRIEPVQGQPE